ncbi:MAG: hypothetical protein ABSF25_05480 [Bryobacteraceae bacterium]
MPVSMEFLRGVLGLIGVGCAYMAGRSAAAVRKGWQKKPRLYGWIVRTSACLIAMAIRHPVDIAEIAVWVVAAAACALAFRSTTRERPPEDLTRTIFPDEP